MRLQRLFWLPVGAEIGFVALGVALTLWRAPPEPVVWNVSSTACVVCPGCVCVPVNLSTYLQLVADPQPSSFGATMAPMPYATIELYYGGWGDVQLQINDQFFDAMDGALHRVELRGGALSVAASAQTGWLVLGNATLQVGSALAYAPSAATGVLLAALLCALAATRQRWAAPRVVLLGALIAAGALLLLAMALDSARDYRRLLALALALAWTLLLDVAQVPSAAQSSIRAASTRSARGPLYTAALCWTGCVPLIGLCTALIASAAQAGPLVEALQGAAAAASLAALGSLLWRLVKRKLVICVLAQLAVGALLVAHSSDSALAPLLLGSVAAQLGVNAPLKTVPPAVRAGNCALALLLVLLLDAWAPIGWAAVALLPICRLDQYDSYALIRDL